ncbi:AI-2E family transporter [Microvirga lotononidis]|uniref:Putative permease n=1 Tax=Microvirga lotononidis TaxID=864069 RepID=I4Z1K3_9HYPH|nr:AI-2E family transporter [Microvirga lotononidis]EIM30095.1 putative permease [Microvirga lotononidis]WQO31862.1 AI-2E family transporter [Microvirga lotononidis]
MKLNSPQSIAIIVLALALLIAAIWTLQSFLPALVWAAIFAIAIWPLSERLQTYWGGRSDTTVPLLLTAAIGMIFMVPLFLVVLQASHEASDVIRWLHAAEASGLPAPYWLTRLPLGVQAATWWTQTLGHPFQASQLVAHLHEGSSLLMARELGTQVAHRAVLFVFTLLTLFFLLRGGEKLTLEMRRASGRIFGPHGERLACQMIASVRATLSGLVLVGLGEGLLLGIAYWIAGVPHPVLLGLFTAIAATIPFGAPIVFGLAALIQLAQGAVTAAIGIVIFGLVVLAIADHLIRPLLIGGTTKLPFIWVLFSILGGVETWGFLGLFVGPAIMASLILLWRELAAAPTASTNGHDKRPPSAVQHVANETQPLRTSFRVPTSEP